MQSRIFCCKLPDERQMGKMQEASSKYQEVLAKTKQRYGARHKRCADVSQEMAL